MNYLCWLNTVYNVVMANFKPIAKNRRANYDYDIVSTLIAGIVLSGAETKSIRAGHVSLKGAFAVFQKQELWLNNMHVSKYKYANSASHNPTRPRKLLLHKSQLDQLQAQKLNGQNLVVLAIGLSGPFIKVQIGIGHSKKRHDKRETIKKRQQMREAAKAIKR